MTGNPCLIDGGGGIKQSWVQDTSDSTIHRITATIQAVQLEPGGWGCALRGMDEQNFKGTKTFQLAHLIHKRTKACINMQMVFVWEDIARGHDKQLQTPLDFSGLPHGGLEVSSLSETVAQHFPQ